MKHFLIAITTVMMLAGCGGAEERKAAYLEKARLSMEAGDLDKARIELKNVLQIDPKHAQAYFQLGNVFELQKNYRKAFGNYSKAEELDPDKSEYHAKMGSFYLLLAGDIDKAIEKRDLILAKDKADISGLLRKAGILLKQNDLASAKKIAQGISSKHPEHIESAIFLAAIHLHEKEYENSIEVLTACIKGHPDNIALKSTLANTYLTAEKHEQAEEIFKTILAKNPELFINHLKLAMFYKKIDKNNKAQDVLRKAIEENEEDLKRKIILIEFIQQVYGNQEAIVEMKALIAKNPGMGELRLALGELYLGVKELDNAEKIFNIAVSDFSEDSVGIKSRVYLASLYIEKEDVDAAVSIINDAVKISPNDTGVNFIKAKLQLLKKDYEGAIISLRTVIKDAPENTEAHFLLSAAHKVNGDEQQASEIIKRAYENNRTNEKGLMALAKYHASNKNSEELEKIIDSYLIIDANNYEALSYKSSLLNKRKMFSEAKTYTLRMIELYPDMPNGYIQSVPYILAENGKYEVVTLLENAYKKVNDKFRILELLVSFQASTKNFDAATNIVQSAIRENSEAAELHMLMAKIQLSSKKIGDAKKTLLKINGIKPEWNEPYLMLANIYMADKQNQKAINILQNGLVNIKSNLKLSLSLAKTYEILGDFNAAISEYEKAYEQHTDNIIIVNNLASLLSEYRNDEKSLKRAKELADKLKNVDQAVILDTVGWVYYKTGDYAGAVKVLKTVVEKSPDAAVFNYHLGMALYKSGDEAAAKTYLTSALANNSNFSGKDDAKEHLQKIK